MNEEELLLELEQRNGWNFNHMKAIEELAELSEVLIKKLNKNGGPKEPSDRSIVEEIGDVLLRLRILEFYYGKDAIKERMDFKLSKFAEILTTNKYKHI
jgi:NTP pyrophosphatase (non-canonical NTP hydrolase)